MADIKDFRDYYSFWDFNIIFIDCLVREEIMTVAELIDKLKKLPPESTLLGTYCCRLEDGRFVSIEIIVGGKKIEDKSEMKE